MKQLESRTTSQLLPTSTFVVTRVIKSRWTKEKNTLTSWNRCLVFPVASNSIWIHLLCGLCCLEDNNRIQIAFKGAVRDFFLQSPHNATNCLQHVRSSGPGTTVCKSRATHRALITCKYHVTCHLVRRDSSAIKFDRVEIAFI